MNGPGRSKLGQGRNSSQWDINFCVHSPTAGLVLRPAMNIYFCSARVCVFVRACTHVCVCVFVRVCVCVCVCGCMNMSTKIRTITTDGVWRRQTVEGSVHKWTIISRRVIITVPLWWGGTICWMTLTVSATRLCSPLAVVRTQYSYCYYCSGQWRWSSL